MMQWIAMTTMLVDHIGLLFFPESETYRIVGRIAFPLYCWFLVQGYRHTRNHAAYVRRLFWLACLSQIPYMLAIQRFELNVIFTLLLALIGLYAADRPTNDWLKAAQIFAVAAAAAWIPMDYGLYGVFLAFIYRYVDGWKMIVAHALLNALFWLLYGPGYWIQLFSVAGTLLVAFPLPLRVHPRVRWLYRTFYPAHLAVLYVVYIWVNG